MDHFAGLGYDTWCVDMEGYGRSDKHRDINADIATGADDLTAGTEYIAKARGGMLPFAERAMTLEGKILGVPRYAMISVFYVRRDIMAAKFPPALQFRWRAGPYRPPVYGVGTILHDEYRGDVVVHGFTKAPIPWPATTYQPGKGESSLLPILCGDLVRAVCEEDELTVAHYWGVSFYMVKVWKQAISGAKDANEVFAGLLMKRNDPKFRKKFGY